MIAPEVGWLASCFGVEGVVPEHEGEQLTNGTLICIIVDACDFRLEHSSRHGVFLSCDYICLRHPLPRMILENFQPSWSAECFLLKTPGQKEF